MPGSADEPVVSLEVSFGQAPPQAMVTPLCQAISELCRPLFGDSDAAERLRLVAHELLENIAKYSSQAGCELRFRLVRGDAGALRARVETRNVPAAERRADVERRLQALDEAQDPLEHYDSIIADSAREPAGSGLGLARIHAETEYRLSYRFEAQALIITASGEVWLKGARLP